MSNSSKKGAAQLGKTVLHRCTCLSEFQDAHYKPCGTRVHNVGARMLTCTVCSAQKTRPLTDTDGTARAT